MENVIRNFFSHMQITNLNLICAYFLFLRPNFIFFYFLECDILIVVNQHPPSCRQLCQGPWGHLPWPTRSCWWHSRGASQAGSRWRMSVCWGRGTWRKKLVSGNRFTISFKVGIYHFLFAIGTPTKYRTVIIFHYRRYWLFWGQI